MLAITTTSERIGRWIKMRRFLAQFRGSEPLCHTRFLAGFITITPGFRFGTHRTPRYENKCYGLLANRFGLKNLYILSAGWGLIRGNFLTPYYDITFSQSADPYKRRRKGEQYEDFRLLSDETADDTVFIGGKDYLPLFCRVTNSLRGKRIAVFNSASAPHLAIEKTARSGFLHTAPAVIAMITSRT